MTVHARVINTRTVQQALLNNKWMEDCQIEISFMAQMQCMHLCHEVATVDTRGTEQDVFTWTCSSSGQYSAKSVYSSLCNGWPKSPLAKCVWRSWAPLKCKIFVWLAMQYRIWTSDRRARHGLQDGSSACYTCLQDEDNADHILLQCPYAREVWYRTWDTLQIDTPQSLANENTLEWWLRARKSFLWADRRGFDTTVTAVLWTLWKQRNARVFNRIYFNKKIPWSLLLVC